MTRNGDYFVPLRDRMRRARAQQADLFVSIHADSIRDRSIDGSSVYILSQRGATDEAARWLAERENASDLIGGVSLEDKGDVLASVLLDLSQSASLSASQAAAERVLHKLNLVGEIRKPMVQQARFMVLKSPDIPSMLVETAYISNPAGGAAPARPRPSGQARRRHPPGVARLFLCRSARRHANRATRRRNAASVADHRRRLRRLDSPTTACLATFAARCAKMRDSRGGPCRFRFLPMSSINQIAAGEVIERPASVVKELVENVTRCGRASHRGGARAGRVRHDPGARRRHRNRTEESASHCRATPPARSPRCRNLERVATLGFRGEALPSIASVSRLSLISRSKRAEHAWTVEARDGELGSPAPAVAPPGHQRRGPRSVLQRAGAAQVPAQRGDRVFRCAAHAGASGAVALRSRLHSGAQWQDCVEFAAGAAHAQRLARVSKLCGEEFAAHVLELRHDTESLRLSGWLALPTFSRSQSDLQFAFLNGRYVRDKLIAGAARLAYQDVLFGGRFCRLCAVSGIGSDAGRCQCASAKARGAISRFAPRA